MKKFFIPALVLVLLSACALNQAPEQQDRLEKMEQTLLQNQSEILKLRQDIDQSKPDDEQLEKLSLMLREMSSEQSELNRQMEEDIALILHKVAGDESPDSAGMVDLVLSRKYDELSQKLELDNKALNSKLSALEKEMGTLKSGSSTPGEGELQELKRQVDRQNAEISSLKQALQGRESGSGQTIGQAAASVPPSAPQSAEENAYEKARAEYNNGNYQNSIELFDAFIKDYPNSVYLGNAHYWKGESRYAMNDWSGALKEFQGVVSKYPNSWKEADSQLKIGMCYMKMGEDAKARAALNLIKRNYPQYGRMDLVNHYLGELD